MADVPDAPEVPPIQQDGNSDSVTPTLTQDAPDVAAAQLSGVWGIYDQSNNPVVIPDSFLSFEYSKDWHLPTYPQEDGSFQTYNRVEMPAEPRVVLNQGGSESDRSLFLQEIATISGSQELYNVVTPEITYSNVSIQGQRLSRKAENGATLLSMELVLTEVRVTAVAAFSTTTVQNPSGAAPVNNGTVQPQTPTVPQAQAASGGTL